MKASDQYLKVVEWSEEDQCYVGSSPGIIGPSCHGDDEAKVYKQLCAIVDEWIEIHQEDNIPLPEPTLSKDYSGKFVLRVGKDLHKALAIRATQTGESLNSFCKKLLQASNKPLPNQSLHRTQKLRR